MRIGCLPSYNRASAMAILGGPCDEGVARAGRGPAPCPRSAEPWVLAAAILGSSLAFLDGTAVNVALPALQAGLGATVTGVQWVIEAYALFLSSLLLVGGSLGDRFGRRRVFLVGVAGFALASAACGLAPGTAQLVAARAVQGVAAALLVPGSLALLSASFPPERRGRAIGTWSGCSAITAAAGPLLGGWLIDHASWRWIFFLNLPLSLAVVAISLSRVPESRDPAAPARLDWAGALLATLGLGGVTYGLVEPARLGWSDPRVLGALLLGGLALAAFLAVEARTPTVMGAVEERHAGLASGINNAVSRAAGLLAVAVLGLVLVGAFGRGLDRRLGGLDLPPAARQALAAERTKLAAITVPATVQGDLRARVQEAIEQAFVDGFRRVLLAAAGLAGLAALTAAWTIPRTARGED